jgi:excisionase family DNA binding protein
MGNPSGMAWPVSARVQRYIPRRGLSRKEAADYIGISPSKFEELRKAGRIPSPKVLDSRLIFTVERLDEFLDALPDENQTNSDDWTAAL